MIIIRTPFRISFFGGGTDYPEWYLHEFKAFSEFIKENELEFEWLAYVSNGEQATARITRK